MFEKKFYKMHLEAEESGLTVWTDIFLSIHETPCFYFCIKERNKGFFTPVLNKEGVSPVKYAKEKNIRVHRIAKQGSRIAFETEEKAFKNLQYLNALQCKHLARQLAFNESFLEKVKDQSFDSLKNDRNSWHGIGLPSKIIDGTKELVNSRILFD